MIKIHSYYKQPKKLGKKVRHLRGPQSRPIAPAHGQVPFEPVWASGGLAAHLFEEVVQSGED